MQHSFTVDIEDCVFHKGSELVEDFADIEALFVATDTPDYNSEQEQIRIEVVKVIDGTRYRFMSPPYEEDMDGLKIKIVFLKALSVEYNSDNMQEYAFVWAGQEEDK